MDVVFPAILLDNSNNYFKFLIDTMVDYNNNNNSNNMNKQ